MPFKRRFKDRTHLLSELCSTCFTILHFDIGLDDSAAMMTLTVFLMTAPPDVTCVTELLTPSIAVFSRGLIAEESPTLRLQTLKTATPIAAAAHPLIATPFIHALGRGVWVF